MNDGKPFLDHIAGMGKAPTFFSHEGQTSLTKLLVLVGGDPPPCHQLCRRKKLVVAALEAPRKNKFERVAGADSVMAADPQAVDVGKRRARHVEQVTAPNLDRGDGSTGDVGEN